jgi:hypothetical protein
MTPVRFGPFSQIILASHLLTPRSPLESYNDHSHISTKPNSLSFSPLSELYSTTTREMISSVTTLLLPLLLLCHYSAFAKRLVVFAGPHKTSETSIEEFFYSYAHGPGAPDQTHDHQQALKHWIWPQIRSPSLTGLGTTPHQVFGHLVTDAQSPEIQSALLEGIHDQFQKAAEVDGDAFQGMIIGSEEFDRVGPSSYSDADAIDAVHRVVDKLSLAPSDVTIVLLYQRPRMDQWFSIFNYVPMEVLPSGGTEDPYHQFLCDPVYARNTAWEALGNAMNPLRVAEEYANQGYKVNVLDLSGLKVEGLDVEHMIGCTVLNAECDVDGFLINLSGESYLKQGNAKDTATNPFPDLSADHQAEMEELFRIRDCTYDAWRTNPELFGGITLEFQNPFFTLECSAPEKQMAEYLEDTSFFLNALQSQVDCNAVPVSIHNILRGDALPPVGNEVYSWEEEKAPEAAAGNTQSVNDNDGDANPKWTMPVFLLLFIAVGAIGLAWIRRADRRVQKGRYSSTPRDLELNVRETTNLSNNIT